MVTKPTSKTITSKDARNHFGRMIAEAREDIETEQTVTVKELDDELGFIADALGDFVFDSN